MNKPIIGIIPLVDSEKDSLWMLPGYMDGIKEAGGIPVMMPLTTDDNDICQMVEMFDGFLFTGGHDVSPKVYGEKALPTCGECCVPRDMMEDKLLLKVLEYDKPILGICRGIQFINAALGGTLYQDLPTEKPSELEHHQQPPYDIPVHSVDIVNETPLFDLLRKNVLQVNSYHHQAIKKLSPKLQAMAYSSDGLVEAIYMKDKTFVWAFQWHPEFAYKVDEDSKKIFESFVSATILNKK